MFPYYNYSAFNEFGVNNPYEQNDSNIVRFL